MPDWFVGVVGVIILCFGFVVLKGAPYLPTLKKQQEEALDMLALKPGETMLELGCGDGKVLVAAAKRGWSVVGYELNPILAGIAWFRTRSYRSQVKIVCGDFWNKEWPEAEGIFTFLLPKYMKKLNKKIIQYKHKPVKLASIAFEIPDRKPVSRSKGLSLYEY